MDFEEDVSIRDKAMDVSDEDGGKAKVDERFEEASMPYFIERAFSTSINMAAE